MPSLPSDLLRSIFIVPHTFIVVMLYTPMIFWKRNNCFGSKDFYISRFLLATIQSSYSVFYGMTSRTVKNIEFLAGEITYKCGGRAYEP